MCKHSTWDEYMQEHGLEEYEAWDKAVAREMEKGHTEECAVKNLVGMPWDDECICDLQKSF